MEIDFRPNMNGAVLQMSQSLHPAQLPETRGMDVGLAIAAIHQELALLRSEVVVLRVAVASELDMDIRRLEECAQMINQGEELLTLFQEHEQAWREQARQIAATQHTSMEHHMFTLQTVLMDLQEELRAIPSTYAWPRFKRFLRRIFRGV